MRALKSRRPMWWAVYSEKTTQVMSGRSPRWSYQVYLQASVEKFLERGYHMYSQEFRVAADFIQQI